MLDLGLNGGGVVQEFSTIMLRYEPLLGSKCKTDWLLYRANGVEVKVQNSSRWVIQSWRKVEFQEEKFSKIEHAMGNSTLWDTSHSARKGQVLKSATPGWATLFFTWIGLLCSFLFIFQ